MLHAVCFAAVQYSSGKCGGGGGGGAGGDGGERMGVEGGGGEGQGCTWGIFRPETEHCLH